MSQNINIWTLPSAAQMLNDVRKELSEGVSLCLVFAIPGDIIEFQRILCHGLLIEDSLTTCSIYLPELETITLANFQKSIAGVEYQNNSLELFMKSDAAPDVIIIQGFDEIENSLQNDTMWLMRRWVEHCHTNADKKSLCLVVPGNLAAKIHEIQLSTTSSRLKIRYLIGMPSALEVQLISRAQSGIELISAEAHWRELLVSSLSGNDLDIAYMLGHSQLNNLDDINEVLKEYAGLNSWELSTFEKEFKGWIPLSSGMKPDMPQHIENIKLLWKQTTIYTPEYGEEIHPAVLAIMGKYDEIRHRVWRSQTTLVLPVIDELRIKIFLLLKNRINKTWNHEEIPEIGELKYSLDQLPVDSVVRQQFYDIVRHARDIRNKLSHVEVINLREYILLWNSWQKIRRMNTPNGLNS